MKLKKKISFLYCNTLANEQAKTNPDHWRKLKADFEDRCFHDVALRQQMNAPIHRCGTCAQVLSDSDRFCSGCGSRQVMS